MKIVIPVDGSDCANRTMHWAADTFSKQTSEYYLIFVIAILPDLPTDEFEVADAVALLRKAQAFMESQGCRVAEAEYLLGEAVSQIGIYAKSMDIDQVVIGSHGRTGLSRLLMGSISEGVLRHCPKPVIVYRNTERKPETHVTEAKLPTNTVF